MTNEHFTELCTETLELVEKYFQIAKKTYNETKEKPKKSKSRSGKGNK
ncbi:hypothetical protein LCGC14_2537930 [marine sediment metagenome]|uniref:Uncharacterized protein n=1 Tax=marine sediment metagenome TaxID=412755 RepID=A0A0F9BEK7_9ZZZZ